jgi:tetratricopeptide (TPR) repeat protein
VVHFQLAGIAFHRDNYAQAAKLWEIALTICREVGDYLGIAQTLRSLGDVASARGQYDQARALFEESLIRFRELGMHGSAATALDLLGQTAGYQGDYPQARRYFEEAHAWYSKMGLRARRDSAHNLYMQGNLARREGGYARATAHLNECLSIAASTDDPEFTAVIQRSLAAVARAEGDYARALTWMRESLLALRGFAWNKWVATETLRQMALLCSAQGQPEKAGRLFAAAEAIRLAIGNVVVPADQAEHNSAVAAVRQALGEDAFAAAWRAGAALTIEQAIDYALDNTEP